MISLEPLSFGKVDTVEDHLELAGRELDPGIGGRVGKVVTPALESLTPQAQAVAAPVKHFQSVSGPIPKDEEVSRERIGVEPRSDEFVKPVESEPQIERPTERRGGRTDLLFRDACILHLRLEGER